MKIAFVCVENSCRSQMAEALAKKMFSKPDIKFVSAGTHPAEKVDSGAIKILKERQIEWTGKPKSLTEIGIPDIIVTMGCDVVCPAIPGVKIIDWDIPDPKGKGMDVYLKAVDIIKSNLIKLMGNLL
jgi:arsenate reductase